MNALLKRNKACLYGVFGELFNDRNERIAFTLEHAFSDGAAFVPKLAIGTYICKRGTHQLEHGGPFTAFEVLSVPDFQNKPVKGILFHVGNYNRDSDGCILLGLSLGQGCILESLSAFESFMHWQEECDEFTFIVQ